MSAQNRHVFEFGPFRLDAEERVLWRDGQPVPLTGKAFDTLLVLVEHRGHIVGKEALMREVWPDSFVEEGNLSFNVSMLRKALGEDAHRPQFIETVPRRGYRFIADVSETCNDGAELIVRARTWSSILIEEEEAGTNASASIADGGLRLADAALVSETPAARLPVAKRAAEASHRWKIVAALGVALLATVGIFVAASKFGGLDRSDQTKDGGRAAAPFAVTKQTKLTQTGIIWTAALSPDGKYVAYVIRQQGLEGMWLRQVATGSTQQLIPPAAFHYAGLAFSRDGNYLYFGRLNGEGDLSPRGLYRMPALGGVPVKVLEDIDAGPAISPDGSRLAFARNSRSLDESALMIANADGTGARKLATRKLSERVWYLAWSPDGRRITVSAGNSSTGGPDISLLEVGVEDGIERVISSQRWASPAVLAWLPDGSGLLVSAREKDESTPIWYLSHPEGEVRRITNDSNHYVLAGVTANSGSLLAIQQVLIANVWTMPVSALSRATQITHGTGMYTHIRWTPDSKILYSSPASGSPDMWLMDANGTSQQQLTLDAGGDYASAVSPDGRYVLFTSNRRGAFNIWRMGVDGSDPVQLTNGSGEYSSAVTPDGRWVLYISVRDRTTWKVPIEGGQPVFVSDKYRSGVVVSPTGKWLAYWRRDTQPGSPYRIAVAPLEGGPPAKIFDLAPDTDLENGDLRWTPDGRALTYEANRAGVGNIWLQPLDGGPPRQLTDFKSERIFQSDWSHDGQTLAVSRGAYAFDLVLIDDLQSVAR